MIEKKSLLLLPGWGMRAWVWDNWYECLKEEYEFFELDWEGVTTENDFAVRVAEQVRLINSSELVIVAWSLGTLAVLEAIVKAQLTPKKLVLVGGTACFTARVGYRAGWSRRVLQKMQEKLLLNPAQVLAEFRVNLFTTSEDETGWTEQFENLLSKHQSEFKIVDLAAGLEYLAISDWRELLPQLTMPILIIHGIEDWIVPMSAAEYLRDNLPHPILKLIPAGHLPFFTAKEQFILIIKEFLDEG